MSESKQINKFENGNVNISDEVLETIATIATEEIDGVSGLSGTFVDDLGNLFKKNNYKKGISINVEDDKVIIDLNILVDFGVKIPDVSWTVQEAVKSSVENMTGLKVEEVNIHVDGIREKKKKEKEKE